MATTPATKTYGGSILEAFLPKKDVKSSATATETTKTDLNAEAINEVIRSMMEGDSGLAALLQSQKGRGLYNSTTADLLAGDLAARVGGKAALASAPTTRTATETKKQPGTAIDPKWALGLQLLGSMFDGGSSKSGSKSGADGGNLGSMINSFTSLFDKDKKKTDSFDPAENYGGFGFTDENFSDFSLGGFSPAADMSLGMSGSNYSYDPFSMTGGGSNDWLFGTGYSGSTASGSSYSPTFSSSGTSLGFGSTGLGSSGINIGWSF